MKGHLLLIVGYNLALVNSTVSSPRNLYLTLLIPHHRRELNEPELVTNDARQEIGCSIPFYPSAALHTDYYPGFQLC